MGTEENLMRKQVQKMWSTAIEERLHNESGKEAV